VDILADAHIVSMLRQEAQHAGDWIKSNVSAILASGKPLNAVLARKKFDGLLTHPELSDAAQSIDSLIAEQGKKSCTSLSTSVGPQDYFWAAQVRDYCAYWREAGPSPRPLPDFVVSGIRVSGNIRGYEPAAIQQLSDIVLSELKETPWYSPDAKSVATLHLGGAISVSLDEKSRSVSRPWTERIPYTDIEEYQEAYQEPYTGVEMYTVQVPYSDTELYTVPCAYTIGTNCVSGTDTRTVTKYRTEYKTRSVTKYRTAYRTMTRPVTKYREHQREYSFLATVVTATYLTDVRAALNLPRVTIPIRIESREVEFGLYHDSNFEPANVRPERPEFSTIESWRTKIASNIESASSKELVETWKRRFCQSSNSSRESAARCAASNNDAASRQTASFFQKEFGVPLDELQRLIPRERGSALAH